MWPRLAGAILEILLSSFPMEKIKIKHSVQTAEFREPEGLKVWKFTILDNQGLNMEHVYYE